MANITVKTALAQGTIWSSRDGTQYTIAAGGLLTADAKYIQDLITAGFTIPATFGATAANITALSGGGQTNATALSYGLNQVATVAAAADSVLLPPAVPGEMVIVVNDGAAAMQVFGTNADTINGVAAATGVSQPQNSIVEYSCVVAGQWRIVPQTGFSGAHPTVGSTANNIASNGTTLANGTLLTADINRVTNVAAANGALTLPASKPGLKIRVTNANGGNTANIFPAVNESINGAANNTSVQLASNVSIEFSCAVAGTWDFIKSA